MTLALSAAQTGKYSRSPAIFALQMLQKNSTSASTTTPVLPRFPRSHCCQRVSHRPLRSTWSYRPS